MLRIILLCFFFLWCATAFGQTYVNQTKGMVRQSSKKYLSKNNYTNSTIQETDTSILVFIRETTLQPATFEYHFTKANKCDWYQVRSNCDSCLRKDLSALLQLKKLDWQQVSENRYVSKYSKRLLLDVISNEKEHFYIVRKLHWTKEEYAALQKL